MLPRLPGRPTARGWCITRGNRAIPRLWRITMAANERQILKSEPGLHNHFQVWSKDGRWIYFVRGRPATREMDLWRISPDGGEPEQTHSSEYRCRLPGSDRRADGSVRCARRKRGRPVVVGIRCGDSNFAAREFGPGTIHRSGSRGGWSASGRECRELSGQLVERSDYHSQ